MEKNKNRKRGKKKSMKSTNSEECNKLFDEFLSMFGDSVNPITIFNVLNSNDWNADSSLDVLMKLPEEQKSDIPSQPGAHRDEPDSINHSNQSRPQKPFQNSNDHHFDSSKFPPSNAYGYSNSNGFDNIKVVYRGECTEDEADADIIIEEENYNSQYPSDQLECFPVPFQKNLINDKQSGNSSKLPASYHAQVKKNSRARNKSDITEIYRECLKIGSTFDRITQLVSNSIKVIVLLRGCPGSGKSFTAEQLISNVNKINAGIKLIPVNHIFSTDDYFMTKSGFRFDGQKLSMAHEWNKERALNAMLDQINPVIIDNTNTQLWEMLPYVQSAVECGYAVEILEPHNKWKYSEQQLFRRNVHGVPRVRIKNMLDRFEYNITSTNILKMLNLTYNPSNQPPQLVPNKTQSRTETRDKKVINTPESNDFFGNHNSDSSGAQCSTSSFSNSIEKNYRTSPMLKNDLSNKENKYSNLTPSCRQFFERSNSMLSSTDESVCAAEVVSKQKADYSTSHLILESVKSKQQDYVTYLFPKDDIKISSLPTNSDVVGAAEVVPKQKANYSTAHLILESVKSMQKDSVTHLLPEDDIKNSSLTTTDAFETRSKPPSVPVSWLSYNKPPITDDVGAATNANKDVDLIDFGGTEDFNQICDSSSKNIGSIVETETGKIVSKLSDLQLSCSLDDANDIIVERDPFSEPIPLYPSSINIGPMKNAESNDTSSIKNLNEDHNFISVKSDEAISVIDSISTCLTNEISNVSPLCGSNPISPSVYVNKPPSAFRDNVDNAVLEHPISQVSVLEESIEENKCDHLAMLMKDGEKLASNTEELCGEKSRTCDTASSLAISLDEDRFTKSTVLKEESSKIEQNDELNPEACNTLSNEDMQSFDVENFCDFISNEKVKHLNVDANEVIQSTSKKRDCKVSSNNNDDLFFSELKDDPVAEYFNDDELSKLLSTQETPNFPSRTWEMEKVFGDFNRPKNVIEVIKEEAVAIAAESPVHIDLTSAIIPEGASSNLIREPFDNTERSDLAAIDEKFSILDENNGLDTNSSKILSDSFASLVADSNSDSVYFDSRMNETDEDAAKVEDVLDREENYSRINETADDGAKVEEILGGEENVKVNEEEVDDVEEPELQKIETNSLGNQNEIESTIRLNEVKALMKEGIKGRISIKTFDVLSWLQNNCIKDSDVDLEHALSDTEDVSLPKKDEINDITYENNLKSYLHNFESKSSVASSKESSNQLANDAPKPPRNIEKASLVSHDYSTDNSPQSDEESKKIPSKFLFWNSVEKPESSWDDKIDNAMAVVDDIQLSKPQRGSLFQGHHSPVKEEQFNAGPEGSNGSDQTLAKKLLDALSHCSENKDNQPKEESSTESDSFIKNFHILSNLFPQSKSIYLEELLKQCQGDVNWAAELLLEGGCEMSAETYGMKRNSSPEMVEVRRKSPDEEKYQFPSTKSTLKKQTKKEKKNVNSMSETGLELKKMIEQNVVLSESSYSDNLLKLLKHRRGEPPDTDCETQLEMICTNEFDNPEQLFLASNDPNIVNEELGRDFSPLKQEPENAEGNSQDGEDTLELVFNGDIISILNQNFGSSALPLHMLDVNCPVKLPMRLARELHSYLMDSVEDYLVDEHIRMQMMIREDEELAKKLQEEEASSVPMAVKPGERPFTPKLQEVIDFETALMLHESDLKNTKETKQNDSTVAAKLAKSILVEKYPNIDQNILFDLLRANNYSLHDTLSSLKMIYEQDENKQKQGTELNTAKHDNGYDRAESSFDSDAIESSWEQSRDEARMHFLKRNEYFQKAQHEYTYGNKAAASFYSQLANMHIRKMEDANCKAATLLLSSQHSTEHTLDLHFYQAKEALQVLDIFLDSCINRLEERRKSKGVVFIITGRGLHSVRGKSIIKPLVKRRLNSRKIRYQEELSNPGMLKCIITRYS